MTEQYGQGRQTADAVQSFQSLGRRHLRFFHIMATTLGNKRMMQMCVSKITFIACTMATINFQGVTNRNCGCPGIPIGNRGLREKSGAIAVAFE
jgi:hypothetical protein